jgi:sterol 3beta-glucosyltransferase
MANNDTPPPKKATGRKLQKRNPKLGRLPSAHIPARLRLGEDAQEDVTAPNRGSNNPAQYMHQSVFSMIAAAGSRTDFNARFDESSDSEEEAIEEEQGNAVPSEPSTTAPHAVTPEGGKTTSDKKIKRLSGKLVQSLPRLSARPLTKKPKDSAQQTSPSPQSDATSKSARSNPRDAPVLSRLLTAEAEFQEDAEATAEMTSSLEVPRTRSRGESSPQTLLATRLMEIFGFEKPEKVVAEYPCWLLKSVLLQGYLYITKQHLCFYAYLPKKSHTVAKTGFLAKRGRTNSKYKRYWFSLKGDVLSYYSDPSSLYFPSGHIDLRYGIAAAVSAEKPKQSDARDFSITTDHRTYNFRCDTPQSAKEWVQSLQKTIFRSHNDGDSVKISLPLENIIDFEESPVVEFAETVKLRVVEDDDSYAIDEVSEL